jgi:RNA polymerase sigma-70 factor (ECF subfamily)
MHDSPDTRQSLLLRVKERGDAEAWKEFVEIYEPVIYRLIRQKGIQHADAQDLVQDALIAVSTAIERWNPDPSRGTFRGWLSRISRNMMINFLTRSRPENQGGGGTAFLKFIEEQPACDAENSTIFDREYQAELFRWAARRIRGEFQESTWAAFWQTSVEGRPIPNVATELGLSVGAVYAARSRVMARLKRKIQKAVEENTWLERENES